VFLRERENQLSVVSRESDCEYKQYIQQCACLLNQFCGEKRHAMGERQNTFVCAFDPQSPLYLGTRYMSGYIRHIVFM